MSVQTIECQISTVLMKRFLDGEQLPQELLDDLEKHLKACPNCRELINNEKVSLEEVLDGPSTQPNAFGAVLQKVGLKTATAGGFATAYPTEALVQASRTSVRSTPPGHAAFKNPKVLFLSGALAIVLIAMTTILKDPTQILGPKASNLAAATADEEDPKDKESTDDPTETSDDSHSESHEDTNSKPEDEESHAADGHKDPETAKDDHSDSTHIPESHSDPKTTTPKQTELEKNTPGKPSINHDEIIIVGSEGTTKKTTQTPPKSDPKTTPKTTTSTKKKASTNRTRKSTPTKKKSGSSGIKVYDQNGKPIG